MAQYPESFRGTKALNSDFVRPEVSELLAWNSGLFSTKFSLPGPSPALT